MSATLYQLTAHLTYARKTNNVKTLVLATGTKSTLCAEYKRWTKVAAIWAQSNIGKCKTKPALTIKMEKVGD